MHNKNYCRRSHLGIAVLGLALICQPLMATEADSPFANEQSLTSSHLVKAVLARSPDITTMEATWAAAKARIEQANSFDDPMLSYTVAPQSSMGGEWPLTVEIEAKAKAGKGSITFDLATGRKGLRCATCGGAGADVPGTVRVDPARRQLIGITTGRVKQKKLRVTIRTAGSVTYDETRLRDVTLKFNGWIGELYANAIGKSVKKGKPLFTVYSPELLSVQEEYLETVRRASA